MKYLSC